ncbi:MAG: hypothetical protein ACPLRW_11930 [Moorellales bacterium]
MAIPVFFALSYVRVMSNLSLTDLSKVLGVSSSFLYDCEEFCTVPSPDLVTGGFFDEKEPLVERIARWLRTAPADPAFGLPTLVKPEYLKWRLAYDAAFLTLWPLVERLLSPRVNAFLNYTLWQRLGYVTRKFEPTGPLQDRPDTDTTDIYDPGDPDTARAVWWFWSRYCGDYSTARRRIERTIKFVPEHKRATDIVSPEFFGIGHLEHRTFKEWSEYLTPEASRLLVYLYIRRFALRFGDETDSENIWWFKWIGEVGTRLRITPNKGRRPPDVADPNDAPTSEPGVEFVFYHPEGDLVLGIRRLYVPPSDDLRKGDDDNSFYFYLKKRPGVEDALEELLETENNTR